MTKRIGILSGTFDPVHKGHVAFGLSAAKAAHLDKVYFCPEVKPRRKAQVSHIAHRLQMLELAVRSQPKLGVLELPGKYFLPKTTMVHLRKQFPTETIVLLLGSDLFQHLAEHGDQWPHVEYLLNEVELVIAPRAGQSVADIQQMAVKLPVQPLALTIADNHHPEFSSGRVRRKLAANQTSGDILSSVGRYAKSHWLYHNIETAKRT